MTSFNHFVQKVCYTVLNSYCQEGILYSLPCHILKVNVILLYFSCLTFWFFLVTYLPVNFLWLLSKFSSSVFSFDTTKAKWTNSYFHIFEKNVLRCEFHKPPLPPPTPKMSREKMSWQVFCEGKGCFLFKVNVVSGLVSAHKALQSPRLQLAVTAVVFKAWAGQEERREGCDQTRSAAVWITYSAACTHVFPLLCRAPMLKYSTSREAEGAVGFCLTSPFESKAPNTKEASCL